MNDPAHSLRILTAQDDLARSLAQGKATPTRLMWPLLKPYLGYFIFGLLLNALHGLACTFQNLTPKFLLTDVLKANLPNSEKLRLALLLALAYFFASAFGRMLVWHCSFRIFTWVRERMLFTLRAHFFRHVNHLCLRFHGQHSSGEMFNYLFGSPLGQIAGFYQHSSNSVPGAIFTISSTLFIIGWWDPVLTGVLFFTILGNVTIMHFARKRMRVLHEAYQKVEGSVVGHIADIMRGSKAVKIYSMEHSVAREFDREAYMIGMRSYERDVRGHVEGMKLEALNYFSYAILLYAAAWRYVDGKSDEGVIAAYLASFGTLTGHFSALFGAVTLWGGAQASFERIGTVLQTASSTPDPQGAPVPVPLFGELALNNVTFGYGKYENGKFEAGQEPALRNVSLKIPYGQRVAICGPSGAGKSTFSQLLLRLYDPQEGALTLEGIDLKHFNGKELRHNFGVVPQDPFIFRTNLRDNLKVARPDATDEEVIQACKRANAWEFIQTLPQGLDTPVGEGGSSLSGGQRQRLAIARALLANPAFFIFDEATSALDTLSEKLIQEALERELGKRTAIFIAHRLSTVKNCDRIIVIRGGKVEQDGPYAELAAQEGLFKEMVSGQQLHA